MLAVVLHLVTLWPTVTLLASTYFVRASMQLLVFFHMSCKLVYLYHTTIMVRTTQFGRSASFFFFFFNFLRDTIISARLQPPRPQLVIRHVISVRGKANDCNINGNVAKYKLMRHSTSPMHDS